jgi:hypothetical protein
MKTYRVIRKVMTQTGYIQPKLFISLFAFDSNKDSLLAPFAQQDLPWKVSISCNRSGVKEYTYD